MKTPDTEWEKEFDEIWEARPAPEQRTHLKEAIKEFISSHTTYLKERVRKEVEGMKITSDPQSVQVNAHIATWEQGYNHAISEVLELDNLK